MSEFKLIGERLYSLVERLFPICRSITGNGVRESLAILQEYIPVEIREVPSGTKVLDWEVPREWNITDAWIKDPSGKKILDFQKNNLHVLNYSIPVHKKTGLAELKEHLYSLPDQPELIPYRTSYYQANWGFCMADQQLQQLKEGNYEVYIDSSLEFGHLSYGELYIAGESEQEILLSAHICHPSLANDNLSGVALLCFLAEQIRQQKNLYSYRFLFIPGTIGSITWLARNQDRLKNIQSGLVTSLLGDGAGFSYKKSRRGKAEIDRVVEQVLKHGGKPYQLIDFFPYGYDERQFCSPGFNLPVGNLSRSQFGQFPEYHSSADNLDFVKPEYLEESFLIFQQIFRALEANDTFVNQYPYGEPQLGKRGLYQAIGGHNDHKSLQMAMLWILNLSDGSNQLLDISERSGISFETISQVAAILEENGLIKRKLQNPEIGF